MLNRLGLNKAVTKTNCHPQTFLTEKQGVNYTVLNAASTQLVRSLATKRLLY